MIIMQTTTELAAALDTTPRTLRKFLRSKESGIESVGKGSRYALPTAKREVNALAKRFNAWHEAQQAPKADEAPQADDAPADEPEAPADELEGPTDAELDAIDAD